MSSSQTKHPWRATARTVFSYIIAVLIAMGAALPVIQDSLNVILTDKGKEALAYMTVIVGAITACVTRLIALPEVDSLLKMIGLDADPDTHEGNQNER